jgi:hypothetical protein
MDTGGIVYHVLIRGVVRMNLFKNSQDFDAFAFVLSESV